MKRIMLKKHSCPCCAQPLLRHISFKRIFWFCHHCYQEMPDLSNFRKTALDTQHWLSKTITDRQQPKEEWPQPVKRPSEFIPNTEKQEAVRVAEDIRSAVKALKIALTNSHPSQYLTLSVGVATLVPMQEYSCAM